MWHLTCDTLHLTPDTWHVTFDILHVSLDTQGVMNIMSKLHVPSSYGLGVKVSWKIFSQIITNLMNKWINCEGVCTTAPATPGLLIIIYDVRERGGNTVIKKQNWKKSCTGEIQKWISEERRYGRSWGEVLNKKSYKSINRVRTEQEPLEFKKKKNLFFVLLFPETWKLLR